MSDESRFDTDADRELLDEQIVTEGEPPPGTEPVGDESTSEGADEDDQSDEAPQARERRRGGGEPVESEEDEA